MHIYDTLEPLTDGSGRIIGYRAIADYQYYSVRYDKWVFVHVGSIFDGATGAKDINSYSWIIHDVLCRDGMFDDHTLCNNWQASTILYDILTSEGRWFRAYSWFAATWLFGGDKARSNGMF